MDAPVQITQDELTKLIIHSTRDEPLPIRIAPGRAWIERGQPGSFRALAALCAIRQCDHTPDQH